MKKSSALLSIFLLLLVGCMSNEPRYSGPSFPEQMRGLGDSLTKLLPFVVDEDEYQKPENRAEIKRHLKKFKSASHTIPAKTVEGLLGKDPLARVNLQSLQDDASRALEAFESGQYKYSRYLAKNTLGYCFSCHTRSRIGPEYDFWNIKNLSKLKLSTSEKTRLFVATRQFDNAQAFIKKMLFEKIDDVPSFYEREALIKDYLMIIIKIKEDPGDGVRFLSRVEKMKWLPTYLRNSMESWKKSLILWTGERLKKSKVTGVKLARQLMSESNLRSIDYGIDRKFVDYMRASVIYHGVLNQVANNKLKAEAYYSLGKIYDSIERPEYWGMPENYFAACVKQYPKSELSKSCYRGYELKVYVGFSGSQGTFIPEFERSKLKELRTLAGIK